MSTLITFETWQNSLFREVVPQALIGIHNVAHFSLGYETRFNLIWHGEQIHIEVVATFLATFGDCITTRKPAQCD
jgi:hypothetical protein